MCGLFGWNFTRQPKKVTMRTLAAALLIQNDNRGGDSWGWFAPKSNSKRVGIGEASSMKRSYLAHMISEPVIIGHTRKATTGSITKQNCHPFDIGRIIGAHNGIVYNHFELNRKFKRDCNVDSEHIFHHLQENEDLTDIEAYGAILLHDRSEPQNPIFFGRFNDGDLSYARVDGGLIWSSSKWHLQTALQLSGLSAKVEQPTEGILYATVGGNNLTEITELDISKPAYVSRGDWQTTSGCSTSYRPWYVEEDEDEKGKYWDALEGKYKNFHCSSTEETEGNEVITEEGTTIEKEDIDLVELTEEDLEKLAASSDTDTFSLVHLNENQQEEKPLRLTLPD